MYILWWRLETEKTTSSRDIFVCIFLCLDWLKTPDRNLFISYFNFCVSHADRDNIGSVCSVKIRDIHVCLFVNYYFYYFFFLYTFMNTLFQVTLTQKCRKYIWDLQPLKCQCNQGLVKRSPNIYQSNISLFSSGMIFPRIHKEEKQFL